jgi:hypothetical protein
MARFEMGVQCLQIAGDRQGQLRLNRPETHNPKLSEKNSRSVLLDSDAVDAYKRRPNPLLLAIDEASWNQNQLTPEQTSAVGNLHRVLRPCDM